MSAAPERKASDRGIHPEETVMRETTPSADGKTRTMRIGFIGAGKAGWTLGKYFADKGLSLSGYYSRHKDSAEGAARFTGSSAFDTPSALVQASDVLFITTPDAAIRDTYLSVAGAGIAGKQLCHCSGALSAADAFPDIRAYGAWGYSIHPLFPISSKTGSYQEIGSAYFSVEGDPEHLEEWKSFFEALGNPVKLLSAAHKTAYHAACAVASNLVCGLIAGSTALLSTCGFTEEQALLALEPLITANIRSILRTDPATALTGPVERCDIETVQKHLSCFEDAVDRECYRAVSLKLIGLARKKHPDTDYSALTAILQKKDVPSD